MTLLEDVPVIDIGCLLGDSFDNKEEKQKVYEKIGEGCRQWGFFQVINHGVPKDVISDLDDIMKLFFSQSIEEKKTIERTRENSRGYFNNELTKQKLDWKEGVDIAYFDHDQGKGEGVNQWPTKPPGFKKTVRAYLEEMDKLAKILLRALIQNLDDKKSIDVNLEDAFVDHTSFARLNYYPVCKAALLDTEKDDLELDQEKDGYLSIHQHTDAGALTVLRQRPGDPCSLQVCYKGKWTRIVPAEDSFTINVGDMMHVWSNDQYVAALHRVLANPTSERFSVPYFYNPSYKTNVEPLVDNPKYNAINWADYRLQRFAGDYADYGKENQISDYIIEKK